MGICAVLTADAVATDEVSCCYCIVRLRSLSPFRRKSPTGAVAQRNDPWLSRIKHSFKHVFVSGADEEPCRYVNVKSVSRQQQNQNIYDVIQT